MNDLFRREVLEARRTKWLGVVSLHHPPRIWLLGALAMAVASTVMLFLVFGEYARRTRVTGQLVPDSGLVTLVAPAGGMVEGLSVREGDAVVAHQPLVTVRAPMVSTASTDMVVDLSERISEREGAMRANFRAQATQLEARREGLAKQRDALASEIHATKREIGLRQEQERLSAETLARFRVLHEQKFVTALQLQQQEAVGLEQMASVQALRRDAAALQRQLAALEQDIAELPSLRDALASGQRREQATLEQERLEAVVRGDSVITSPRAGVVTAVHVTPGQSVQAGQAVLSLLPGGSLLEAHLLVPSRAVGFIRAGDSVLLRYQAFPYQKFGQGRGLVVRVSRSAVGRAGSNGITGNGDGSEPMYRVVVKLDRQTVRAFGVDEPLKPGMLLEADVMGERRSLWEWVLEPLYTISGRV